MAVQFVPDDCHINLSGKGQVTEPEKMPAGYQELAKGAKAVMKVKIYYGEYVRLPENAARSMGPINTAREFFSGILEYVLGRTNRRLFVFR